MNNKVIKSDEYTIIIIYITNLFNSVIRKIYLIIKIHIIKDLKINMFINTNIITP